MMTENPSPVNRPDPASVLIDAHRQVSAGTPTEWAQLVLAGTDTDRSNRRAVLTRLAAVALAAYLSGVRTGGAS